MHTDQAETQWMYDYPSVEPQLLLTGGISHEFKLNEDLLRYQVRMSAMQAAVALYCCHGDGGAPGMSAGELRENLRALDRTT